MRQSFPAAELGVLAVEILVQHEEDVQCLRTGVRHQCQQDGHTFVESDFLLSGHVLQPAVRRRRDRFNRIELASLPEV